MNSFITKRISICSDLKTSSAGHFFVINEKPIAERESLRLSSKQNLEQTSSSFCCLS